MLDALLKARLQDYLQKLVLPIELVATLDDSAKSRELQALLEELAQMSPLIEWRGDGAGPRRPSFAIRRRGSPVEVVFAGIPLGHEFNSLVLALLQVGGHPPKLAPELVAQIAAIEGEHRFETWYSLSCQNCPDLVQALNTLSVLNPRIRHVAIDGALFAAEGEARQVLAVPSVFLDDAPFGQGRMSLQEILTRLDKGAAAQRSAALQARAPYEVLVVGGGPAGAAAAIYAARKGIRTGLVAERFGGQVLDTLAIENFISVSHTEGPRLARDLEQHVREYAVDLLDGERVQALRGSDGDFRLELAGGATLRARSVVLAPGARWRQMGVPGEQAYRNRGVAYCPHCDGPLFKGKRVAVIGGGNSGAEAAIDLAGLASEVTLIEFDERLRADEVLQRKLRSLSNLRTLVAAQTTEVLGDGQRVTGLRYRDRRDGALHGLDLEGIFVQIGLVPNTEWLRGSVELSARGEIVIDAHGRTSLPGVFAAGDATTVPYKQIVIAMGAGSQAALAAFEHRIRMPLAAAA